MCIYINVFAKKQDMHAKGFSSPAEFEESKALGCSNKKVFDFVKNGLVKLTSFPDYTQYMVRGGGDGTVEALGDVDTA